MQGPHLKNNSHSPVNAGHVVFFVNPLSISDASFFCFTLYSWTPPSSPVSTGASTSLSVCVNITTFRTAVHPLGDALGI